MRKLLTFNSAEQFFSYRKNIIKINLFKLIVVEQYYIRNIIELDTNFQRFNNNKCIFYKYSDNSFLLRFIIL